MRLPAQLEQRSWYRIGTSRVFLSGRGEFSLLPKYDRLHAFLAAPIRFVTYADRA